MTARALQVMRLFIAAILAIGVNACGHTPVKKKPKPAPVKPKPLADAFATFGGKRVAAGAPFRISSEPVGVMSVRTVLKLQRATWTAFTPPGGREEKEYTAHILVRRGGKSLRLRIDEGETKRALGVSITAKKIGEVYVKARTDWFPFAVLMVK